MAPCLAAFPYATNRTNAHPLQQSSLIFFKGEFASLWNHFQMKKRNDWVTALLIDAVLDVAPARGSASAARRLTELGIPMEIIVRILTRPSDRRRRCIAQPVAISA